MKMTTLSRQCTSQMHVHCPTSGCDCDCHQVCDRCGDTGCQNTYRILTDDGKVDVCAECYRQHLRDKNTTRTSICACGNEGAHRQPGSGSNVYMCHECHVAAGHRTNEYTYDYVK